MVVLEKLEGEDEDAENKDEEDESGNEEEEAEEEVCELPSPEREKKRFKSLAQMKRKCSGRVRWEIGFA